MIYYRESNHGTTVKWTPEKTELAEQAMTEIVGEIGVQIDNKTAAKVRDRYDELLNQ